MSKIVLTAASRVGCVRSNNEDMVLAFNKQVRSDIHQIEQDTADCHRFVIALADGMGGHSAGEVASELVLSNLDFFVSDLPDGLTPEQVVEQLNAWLQSVNILVNSNGNSDPSKRDMGTTLVAVLYYDGHFYWMSCGDSRLYRLRGGKLKQLTTDHSLNMETGSLRHSHVLTNCIGAGIKNLYLDMEDFTRDMQHGDVYLLCSDGLNDMISDADIEALLNEGASANRLCEAAIEAGGFDNVSTIVFSVNP